MLYLERNLTEEEQTRFIAFLKKLNATPHSVCNFQLTAGAGKYELDTIEIDSLLGSAIPEYDADACTYKGESASMHDVIKAVYGGEIITIIQKLMG